MLDNLDLQARLHIRPNPVSRTPAQSPNPDPYLRYTQNRYIRESTERYSVAIPVISRTPVETSSVLQFDSTFEEGPHKELLKQDEESQHEQEQDQVLESPSEAAAEDTMFFSSKKSKNDSQNFPLASHTPIKAGTVDAVYFKSLDELEDWYQQITSPNSGYNHLYDEFKKPTEQYGMYERDEGEDMQLKYEGDLDYKKGKHSSNSFNAKVMIVHDFKNGYQEYQDLKSNGYFPHPTGERYFLQFPQLIDDFVYFSHHRITIPPVGWINTCHKNNIKCLGTIIFEGNKVGDFLELDKLVDKEFKFVEYLTKLVEHFQFDGFLINIETVFSNERYSKNLIPFINKLRNELSILNSKNEIIWYDSYILKKNIIHYINGVSKDNYDFFNNSDLFLTNYWWTTNNLQENIKNVGILGVSSKLFVGCDVWGRGNLIGGGGFDIALNVKEAVKYRSNVGLFAPAWTYEYLNKDDFLRNNTKFWVGLSSEEKTSEDSQLSIHDCIAMKNSPVFKTNNSGFIFYTNFSNGQGYKFYQGDKLLTDKPWVDNNFQFEVPVECYRSDKSGIQMKLSYSDSKFGGSCLKFKFSELYEDNRMKIYINNTRNKLKLFTFNRELKFDIIGVKYSIKMATPKTQKRSFPGRFQLELRYFIEKRYPSTNIKTRVRSGSFIIPLTLNKYDTWETREQYLQSSVVKAKNEFLILKDIELVYVREDELKMKINHHNKAQSGVSANEDSLAYEVKNLRCSIEDSEYDELLDFDHNYADGEGNQSKEDWVLITKSSAPVITREGNKYYGNSFKLDDNSIKENDGRPNRHNSTQDSYNSNDMELGFESTPIIKIGDMAVINTNDYRSGNYFNIKRVEKIETIANGDDKLVIKWNSSMKSKYVNEEAVDRNHGVLNFLVFINDEFKGLSNCNLFEIDLNQFTNNDINEGKDNGKKETTGLIKLKTRIDTVDKLGNLIEGITITI